MAIRYDTKLTKDIQRVVRNFNQKIDRLERINDKLGIYDLPDKISIKALKKSVTSRKELYRKLDDLSLFSKRGVEEAIQTESGLMSRYDYELLKKEQRRLKSYYTRKIHSYENLSPRIGGKKQIGTLQTLGDEYLQQLKARREYLNKDITKLDKDHLEYFKDSLTSASKIELKAERYYDTYINDMYMKLGYNIGYDKDKLSYIQSRLKELTPQQFDKARRIESALQTVDDFYTDIHSEKTLQQNKEEISARFDLLYESIDDIIAQAKVGYID